MFEIAWILNLSKSVCLPTLKKMELSYFLQELKNNNNVAPMHPK